MQRRLERVAAVLGRVGDEPLERVLRQVDVLGGKPGGAREVDWVALGDTWRDAVGGAGLPIAVDDRVRLLVAPGSGSGKG